MTLDEFMTAEGLTDEDVAGAIGVSRPHVTRMRHRERAPSLDLALKIEAWSRGRILPKDLAPEAADSAGADEARA